MLAEQPRPDAAGLATVGNAERESLGPSGGDVESPEVGLRAAAVAERAGRRPGGELIDEGVVAVQNGRPTGFYGRHDLALLGLCTSGAVEAAVVVVPEVGDDGDVGTDELDPGVERARPPRSQLLDEEVVISPDGQQTVDHPEATVPRAV